VVAGEAFQAAVISPAAGMPGSPMEADLQAAVTPSMVVAVFEAVATIGVVTAGGTVIGIITGFMAAGFTAAQLCRLGSTEDLTRTDMRIRITLIRDTPTIRGT
jgi:hypothetical protein